MKKIFALVLAMAMVLSLSTALAATWGNNSANTTAAAAVTIEVTKYVILKDAANQEYYSKLDDAAIVKAGDQVAFQVKIKVPSANALNTQFGTDIFNSDGSDVLQLKIAKTNVTNGTNQSYFAALPILDSAKTYYLTKTNIDTAAATASDASMYLDTASEYGAVDLKVYVKFVSELSDITIKSGDAKFGVSKSGSIYTVTNTDYRTGATVAFDASGSNGKVVGITVVAQASGIPMTVKKIDGVYQCEQGSATAAEKFAGDDYLNKVLSLLGFSAADALYSGTVYMDDANWAQNFGVYFVNSNNATYAPFTPVPVTVTPTTTIPKTGSNASVIGFAMVALAVVAAAVVAVRKVRA